MPIRLSVLDENDKQVEFVHIIRELFIMNKREGVITSADMFRILRPILSGPVDFLRFKYFKSDILD